MNKTNPAEELREHLRDDKEDYLVELLDAALAAERRRLPAAPSLNEAAPRPPEEGS